MKKPKEKIKVQKSKEITLDFLDSSLENIKTYIEQLIDEGWETTSISYCYSQIYGLILHADRYETDEEFARRLKEWENYKEYEKQSKLKRQEEELKEYERLKKKFEPNCN